MDNLENKRLDNFYVEEDHFSNPKEYFKNALTMIQSLSKNAKKQSLVDIGCAAGDFIRFVAQHFPDWEYAGIDLFDQNLNEAKKRYPKGDFFKFDMCSNTPINIKNFNIVTMLGTLSIFNSTQWIKNFVHFLGKGSTGIIFGIVNPYPYDVFVSLKKFGNSEFEFGWNSWCFETIQEEFKKLNCITKISRWQIPVLVPEKTENPLRSWTIPLEDGSNLITNGSRVIHDFAFITVIRN
jgi:SAM-dependent methyltransferase